MQYHTQEIQKNLNNSTKTHWSVAQAGWNDEKNWMSQISLNCPFNDERSREVTFLINCASTYANDGTVMA